MQEPSPLDPPEQELESALASLAPASNGVSADLLWSGARIAIERRRANRWRAAAAIAILTAGAAMFWRPKPLTVTVDRQVVVVREQPRPEIPAPAVVASGADRVNPGAMVSNAYLRLRDSLAQNGLDSLPATAMGDGSEAVVPHAGPLTREGFEGLVNSKYPFIRGG